MDLKDTFSKTQKISILAMTVCGVDVYPQKNETHVGGNSVNFAVQCIKQGVANTSVLGCVGSDDFGWNVIQSLIHNKVNITHLYAREGRTASNRIYISETGDRFFLPDSWDGGVYQTFLLSQEDWIFAHEHDIIAIPANNPNFQKALEEFSGTGKLVVDFLDSRDFCLFEKVFPQIALGFISGDTGVVSRLKHLSETIEIPIVVTLGAEGSITLYHGKEFFQKAFPVETIIDSTGCGDSYQAAFTVSWFNNSNILMAMKAGASAAAETLKHMSGIINQSLTR